MKKILTAVLLIATLVSASAQTQKRPYLLMTEARTEAAKQRLKNDQMLNDAWKNIREFADKNIKSNDINKLEHLSLAYLMTGDDKYGDRELNRRAPGPLRLWCGKLALNRDCPLADYRGQIFAAPPPEWWELK